MPFDEFGFLGSQIKDISKQIYESNRDIFDLCHDLNNFAQKVKFEFSIDSNNGQQVIASTLFIKVLHGFQSTILLFKHGLASEGKVIARSIMETMFTLKAICDNEDAVREYIQSDNAKREKLLNVILNEPDQDIFSTVKKEITPEFIDSIKVRNRDQKVRDISAQEWAEKAGLKSHYQTAYRILSDEVHTTPRALQQYLKEDDNGLLKLECAPSTDDFSPTLITALITLLISLDSLCTIFSINHGDELNQFEARIHVKA